MGLFVRTKYEDNEGIIHPMRLSEGIAFAAGTPPDGPITSRIPAMVTKTNRQFGLRPRGVNVYRYEGVPPSQKLKHKFVPLRSQADKFDPKYADGASMFVSGGGWTVLNYEEETYG